MQCKALVLLCAVSALSSSAMAGSWLYSGPEFVEATPYGYLNAHILGNPGSVLTNDGKGVGDATLRTNTMFDAGARALAFGPTQISPLTPISTAANGTALASALAINEINLVVGSSKRRNANGVDLGTRAVRWDANTFNPPVELNPINTNASGVVFSEAVGINEGGIAIGTSGKYKADGSSLGNRAVKWLPNQSVAIELPITQFNQSAGGFSNTSAVAINDAGVIVGTTEGYDNSQQFAGTRAIRWKPNNTYAVLNPLGYNEFNQTMCEAVDVNEAGVTVGVSNKYDYNENQKPVGRRAVRWQYDSISGQELGGLGGTDLNGSTSAQVQSVSDGGLVLGQSNKYLLGAAIGNRPVYWLTSGSTAANELPNLGASPAGITHGMANAANDSGYVVGWTDKYTTGLFQGERAVLWKTDGVDTVTDLNTLLPAGSGWQLTNAVGITDTGFVSGIGLYNPDGAGGADAYQRLFTMLVPHAGTYGKGDANFDTKVSFDDLLIVAQHYGQSNNTHNPNVGDFDLNGSVTFDDLLIVAQNYGLGALVDGNLSDAFMHDWAMAQSMVPEPASLTALAGIAMVLRRRR